jgi:hypothetical protein
MNRSRRWSVLTGLVVVVALLSAHDGQAQEPEKKEGDKPVEKWLVDRTVTVSPARAPVPALKYRLYPTVTERKEGNAVPMYLRFAHERSDARKKLLREKPDEWNKLPLDKLPLSEVKEFLDGYSYNLRQLELGARRKTADWNYALDSGSLIELLLPDAQEMRMHAPLLVLKARVEIAEGRFADAIRTLETGFSFSQQINEGPFLINSLVGIACANQFADCLLELSERPDAPNLYWATTVLPRPLCDLRKAMEHEQAMPEMQFPDLADLGRDRSPEDWDRALIRVRKEIERLSKNDRDADKPKPGTTSSDPAAKSPDLTAARNYLTEVVRMRAEKVESMPPAQALLLYMSNYYHEYRDETFKPAYLPYSQSRPLSQVAAEHLKAVPDTEAGRLVRWFLPAVFKVRSAQARIERKLAVQRVIEALRMHAAANDGQLPDKLDQVKIVPIPSDPGTGEPFVYERDGKTATIISRIPGEALNATGLRYHLTIRK